jgi:hypothetical protein
MKSFTAIQKETTRHIRFLAFAAALVIAATVALPQPAQAAKVTPPPMPDNIQVPEGNEPFLVGHAMGTQNYVCLPADSGVAYKLITPQATLFDDNGKQITTHFFSPNPSEDGTVRPAWQDSKGTSTVWAMLEPGNSSTDPNYVEPGAIGWLLLTSTGVQEGASGGDMLMDTTFIQRLNTSGGMAPATGCAAATDIGNQAFVPYQADYFFYRSAKSQ